MCLKLKLLKLWQMSANASLRLSSRSSSAACSCSTSSCSSGREMKFLRLKRGRVGFGSALFACPRVCYIICSTCNNAWQDVLSCFKWSSFLRTKYTYMSWHILTCTCIIMCRGVLLVWHCVFISHLLNWDGLTQRRRQRCCWRADKSYTSRRQPIRWRLETSIYVRAIICQRDAQILRTVLKYLSTRDRNFLYSRYSLSLALWWISWKGLIKVGEWSCFNSKRRLHIFQQRESEGW